MLYLELTSLAVFLDLFKPCCSAIHHQREGAVVRRRGVVVVGVVTGVVVADYLHQVDGRAEYLEVMVTGKYSSLETVGVD